MKRFAFPSNLAIGEVVSFVKVAPSVMSFRRETEEKFMIEASKTVNAFAYLMAEFATNDAPFSEMTMPELHTSFSFARLEGIVRKTIIDFASYLQVEATNNAIMNTALCEDFGNELVKLVAVSCQAIYITKTSNDLTSFMLELRKPGDNTDLREFERQDNKLKSSLAHFYTEIQQKKQNQMLLHELVTALHLSKDEKKMLQLAIKFGYPIPKHAMRCLVDNVNKILDKDNHITIKVAGQHYGTRGNVVEIDQIDGCFFVTNEDYHRFTRLIAHQTSGNHNLSTGNSFLLEALQKRFPSSEAFRESEIFRKHLCDAFFL
ncbi:unnamed protein product, partial [Mesorhabditis belari]|uniref:Uncharacterized protein n=1 Tax=Mesorhabditis belari TaxID=2138241 RepID=A0AAF3J8G6_9BILA